jgi:hypothetical protein
VYNVELQDNPNPDVYWSMAHGGLETYQERHVIKWWLSQHNYVHKHLQGVIGVCLRTYIRWMIGSTPASAPAADVPSHFITSITFYCVLGTQLDGFALRGTFMTNAPQHQAYFFLSPPQVELMVGRLAVMNTNLTARNTTGLSIQLDSTG